MPIEWVTMRENLPDYINADNLDNEYTGTAISKMFKVNGARANSFIGKMERRGKPIAHRITLHNGGQGFKKLYRLSDVLISVMESGDELQPTDFISDVVIAKKMLSKHTNLLKEIAVLESKKSALLREVDFLSGDLSDIHPVLKKTLFSLVPACELVKKSNKYEGVCGVYFLIKSSKIVYIGQSKNIALRINRHTDKDFDSVSYIACAKSQLDILETLYILAYKPTLNGAFKTVHNGEYRPATPISLTKIISAFSKKELCND